MLLLYDFVTIVYFALTYFKVGCRLPFLVCIYVYGPSEINVFHSFVTKKRIFIPPTDKIP